jgi:chloramphenicol 3-O-phosphotransferase
MNLSNANPYILKAIESERQELRSRLKKLEGLRALWLAGIHSPATSLEQRKANLTAMDTAYHEVAFSAQALVVLEDQAERSHRLHADLEGAA